LKIRLPRLKIRRPHLKLGRPHLKFRQYQAGALWALVAVAALATLPSLVPGSSGPAFGAGVGGLSAQDEAAARYEAWLRGRAAGQDTAGAAAAAQQASDGPGAAVPTPAVTTPTASDTDIPAMALRAYHVAESWASGFKPGCKLSWSVLAGIGRVESHRGRHLGDAGRSSATGDVTPAILGPVLDGAPNTGTIHDTDGGRLDANTVWDRAVGPMQFIPSTWQSQGRDGNDDGISNPNNLFDAAVSAAGYLCLTGGGTLADQANLRRAVYSYNHSWDYVAAVLSWANFYLEHAGKGSLVEVQLPTGPSSSIQPGVAASGTGLAGPVATTPSGATVRSTVPGTPSSPTTPSSQATTSPSSSLSSTTSSNSTSSSSTSVPTTQPPSSSSTTTTEPPSSSSTTTTEPPTTTSPCTTTTTSSTSSTTTTTTTSDTTTTTTTSPCPDGQGEAVQTTDTQPS